MYNKRIFKRWFNERGIRFFKNFLHIPKYFKQMNFLIKNGYDEWATFETFDWFTYTMKSILTKLRNNHFGSPQVIDDFPTDIPYEENKELCDRKFKENEDKWNGILDRMIYLLGEMDENNEKYDNNNYEENMKMMNEAKDEFFTLFSKYFYYLWD